MQAVDGDRLGGALLKRALDFEALREVQSSGLPHHSLALGLLDRPPIEPFSRLRWDDSSLQHAAWQCCEFHGCA